MHAVATVKHALTARGDDIRALRVVIFMEGEALTTPIQAFNRLKTNQGGTKEHLTMSRH